MNLGPLFFIIFFNDLPYSLDSPVDSYADDTSLSATGSSVAEIGDKLTSDCERVSFWMRANKLKLNPDKTHILTVGTQERLNTLTNTIRVVMDDTLLSEDPTKCELLLGCQISSNMKWHKQVAVLTAKLRTRLLGINHLKYICNYDTRKTITEGMFNSVLVYCLSVFGGLDKCEVKEVQVLQNKAARLVCLAPPRARRVELYKKLGWLSVNQLISYHDLITVFRIRNSSEPEYLAEFLRNDNRNGSIVVPNQRLSVTQKSFVFRGSTLWNQLPLNVRNSAKIGSFKRGVKQWIISNIDQFLD